MNKKKEQLGIDPSTAANQLKKIILFNFVKINHLDICFHCNEIIKTADELSIEHKIPWLDSEDPKGLFFNLDNIAYSHLICNVKASRKTLIHGRNRYGKGCRCDICTAGNTLHKAFARKKRTIRSGINR